MIYPVDLCMSMQGQRLKKLQARALREEKEEVHTCYVIFRCAARSTHNPNHLNFSICGSNSHQLLCVITFRLSVWR